MLPHLLPTEFLSLFHVLQKLTSQFFHFFVAQGTCLYGIVCRTLCFTARTISNRLHQYNSINR